MSNNNLHNVLTDIVKEKKISDIIIENKEDMDLVHYKNLHAKWAHETKRLSKKYHQAKDNVDQLKEKVKSLCKHTDVTEIISDGWERAHHDYQCNICGFYVQIHDEFDYRNITKTIDY